MSNPILRITDGTDTVDLLSTSSGIVLEDWNPSIAQLKAGGIYRQSVMSDGKQLVMSHFDNAIETFTLKAHSGNQDRTIYHTQELFRLLEKARSYWILSYPIDPVYIEARAPEETNTRYAIVHNYSMSSLDNPYATPFFACYPSTMDELTLVVERGHWQNVVPGSGQCVSIAGSTQDIETYLEQDIAANADDGYARLSTGHTATVVAFNGIELYSGRDTVVSNYRYGTSVRFTPSIPANATITSVYIQFTVRVGRDPGVSGNGILQITGEDADNAGQISGVADWNSRVRTSESVNWSPPIPYVTSDVHQTPNIKDVADEIRDRPGWSSGNAMIFFIEEELCDNDFMWHWAANEHPSIDQPKLIVNYSYDSGESTATCEERVFMANKYATANVTNIYVDDGGVFGANQAGSTSFDLLPATPAVNDAVYFGSTAGPFNNLVFDLSVHEVGVTEQWEYYQGAPTSAWTAFSAANIRDETNGFGSVGVNVVNWAIPTDSTNGDWVQTTVNSVSAWWVRYRVTAVSSPSPPTTQNNSVYSVTWPVVSFADDQVGGDIPAIARVEVGGGGQGTSSPTVQHRVIMALQSARGPYGNFDSYDFSAYLPCSDVQKPSVMYGPYNVSGDHSFVNDVTAPSGRAIQLNPSGTGVDDFTININSLHYFGSYRVFMRVRQDGGSDNDFAVKIQQLLFSTEYAETNYAYVTVQSTATAPNWQLLDLGTLNIPVGLPAVSENEGADIVLKVRTQTFSATGDLYYMDIILMPVDEWIVDVQDLGVEGFSTGRYLHIDSLAIPKTNIRTIVKWNWSSYSLARPVPWKTIGSQVKLPANIAGKLWVLTARRDGDEWISDAITPMKVNLYTSEQYLGLRGSR